MTGLNKWYCYPCDLKFTIADEAEAHETSPAHVEEVHFRLKWEAIQALKDLRLFEAMHGLGQVEVSPTTNQD